MAEHTAVKHDPTVAFSRKRVHAILAALEAAAGGDYSKLPLSKAEDELDAIAHAVNALLDELSRLSKTPDGA
jgi:hypothetical protein